MTMLRIPFNRPAVVGEEMRYVAEAIAGGHLSGDGDYTRRCHAALAEIVGEGRPARALLTTSCTHALELAALLLDLEPGDEVLIPSFTFVSTANAFALRGAVPVFVDIRPDTLCLDVEQAARLITPRTRAVLPVHYAGVTCDLPALAALASAHDLVVIEDNAHGFLGSAHGRALGAFGALSALSFHETKNLTCGEGGALIVNDPALVERAEIVREKGTNRSQFFRGQVDKYTWMDLGSSYLPSELLAAFLWGQLEARARVQAERARLWTRYREALAPWAERFGVGLPYVPPGTSQPFHMFYLLLPSLAARTALTARLRERGILAVFHYVPLDSSPMGRRIGRAPLGCPHAADVSDRLLRLPLYFELGDDDQQRVIDAVTGFTVG
jgi:dTDP-4-amino-4,6-dideoxygalactose transaminase